MRPFRVFIGLAVIAIALLTFRYTLALLNYPSDLMVLVGACLTLGAGLGLGWAASFWIPWAFPSLQSSRNDKNLKEKEKIHE